MFRMFFQPADKKGGHQPLFTYMSAGFREVMRTGIPLQAGSQAPLFKNIQRFAHSNVLDSSSTKSLESPLQAERVDIAVPKSRSHKVGARLESTLGEDGRIYYVVVKIPTSDPTVVRADAARKRSAFRRTDFPF